MEKQKADSGILQKFILNCNYVSTWSSMKFLINDNEEENTIKRDVYIQWRVGDMTEQQQEFIGSLCHGFTL